MTVTAKFRCVSITDTGLNKQIKFIAVSGKEGENADYAKYTPSGNLDLTIDNETKASDLFKPQEDYFLTFEKA